METTRITAEFLDSQVKKSNIPGIQYTVLNADSIIFEYSNGFADIKNKRVMDHATTMMACSMTKVITAAAILQIIEKGSMHLDDKINKYIDINQYNQNITIRHLLSQTSGIPNPIPLRWAHLADNHNEFNENIALSKVVKKYPQSSFFPGGKYAYSNISYWYLGEIIEEVSGMTYEEYVREYILMQLGLEAQDMNFIISDSQNHAKGYLSKYSFLNMLRSFLMDKELIGKYEGKWLNINNYYLNGPAFGGLIGSSRAFSMFLQDQLKKKSALFGLEAKKMLYTQQKNNIGELINMTLGWHIDNVNGSKYFFKEGGGCGFHSEMRLYPKQKIASVIMVNKTNFNSKKYLHMLDKQFLYKGASRE